MSVITFVCPRCQKRGQAPDHFAGKSAACPHCKQPLIIPGQPSEPATVMLGSVTFYCPCGATVQGEAGQKVYCQGCGQKLLVPENPKLKTTLGSMVPTRREEIIDLYPPSPPPAPPPAPHYQEHGQTTVIVNQAGAQFPHGIHLLLTFLTCGAWLPIWLIHWLISSGGR